MKQGTLKQNVGIDVSKDDFKANLSKLTEDFAIKIAGSRTFPNTGKGFKQLLEWSRDKSEGLPITFTMEATGVYYEGLAYYLEEEGMTVQVVLPNQSKKYGQSLGVKSKTDKIDARILAQMGLERQLKRWQPISAGLRILTRIIHEPSFLLLLARYSVLISPSKAKSSYHCHIFSNTHVRFHGKPYHFGLKTRVIHERAYLSHVISFARHQNAYCSITSLNKS